MKKTFTNNATGAANGKNRPKTYYIYALAICAAAIAALALSIAGCGDNSPSGNQSDELDAFLNKFSKDPSGPSNNGGEATHTLTIYHDVSGGSVARNPAQEKYGAETRVTITASPKDGYTFTGWLGDIESKDPSIIIKMDGNKTLYANFQQNGTTQNPSTLILFDINGATGNAPAQIKVNYGNSTPLPEPEGISKSGYRFVGWNTSRDGEGTDYGYGAGASYTFTDEVVILYAKWTLNEYPVIWNTNGGAPAPTQTSVTHGGDIIAPSETMTKTGYRFDGWYTNEALSGTAVAFPINNVTNDRTLYAKWTLNTYTVTFNAGANGAISAKVDGNAISSGAAVQHGKNVIFTATPTAGSGYGVNVWTRDGNTVAAGDAAYILENISAATTITVSFVKLTVDKFTVAFNTQDGGATAVSPQSVELNGNVVKPANPTRTGYTFGGWYKEAACTNPWYFETDVVTGATTLYAKWTVNSYAVTWYADGGSPVPTQMSVNHGGSITVPAAMSKTGYTFGGWYSNEAKTVAVTFPINNVTATTTTSFYAKWTINTYTVTWYADGGSPVPTQTSVNHGGSITAPGTMSKTGYTFGGWYAYADFSGTAVGFPIMNVMAGTTFYAKWTLNTYTLTTTVTPVGSGTVSRSPDQGNYNAGASVIVTATAANGYTFTGWSGSSTGMTNPLTITMDGNKALTANFYPSDKLFTDSRDAKLYKKVTIGSQTWMAENLNYQPSSGNSWCYDNKADSCAKYGRLYDWSTAMNISTSYNSSTFGDSDVKRQGVCPSGWHLPSRAEWTTLVNYAGGSSTAGTKLKSTSGWYNSDNGTDNYGFSALPGGYRYSDGDFAYAGYDGRWWSATETDATYAYRRNMDYGIEDAYENYTYKGHGFSVRCLGD